MKKSIVFLLAIITILCVTKLFIFSSNKIDNNDENYRNAFDKQYKIFALEIPDNLEFAGEKVPLEMFYVRENLDRELLMNTYWHSNTILLFKRSNRWFPIIEPILKKNNIPNDFKYLGLIESGLTNVVSPAGATGFWQFIEKTGTEYGLEINNEIDERYHVEKSTQAACEYLKESYNNYKNWTLAAASYNMGRDAIDKRLKNQKTSNYYYLNLNSETARYIFRILAIKIIFNAPSKYGFYIRKKDLYPQILTKTLTIDTTISDLADFAIKNEINYRTLKEFNPWLRNTYLNNKDRKSYEIKIPEKGYDNYDLLIDNIENKDSILK